MSDYGRLISGEPQGQKGLVGKYRLIAKLGRGGMADVFLALAQGPGSFNKLVVVKRLRNVVAEDDRHVLMFVDEAKLSARMNHPNIVQTYEVGGDHGAYFIVLEYLEGQSLKRLMRAVAQREPGVDGFTRGAWVRIVADVLRGLHYAHELCDFDGRPLGIVHRDVSPHNIFITYDGAVKLVDFGVAKAVVNASNTESGTLKGKIAYMAPEQASASKAVDRRADIFAAGIVLWELLAGRRLFEGDHISVMHQLVMGSIPRLSAVVPDIPIALDQIAAKALDRDPARRYATAEEMCAVLESYLEWSGEAVRMEQVGAALHGVFERSRASMRQQIKSQLDQVAGYVDAIDPASAAGGDASSVMFPSASGLPLVGDQSRSGADKVRAMPSESVSLRAAMVPASTSKRGYLVGASGVLALLAIVGGAGYLMSRPTPVERAPADMATSSAATPVAPSEAGPTASVAIVSDPPDATVSWNGRVLGKTPLRMELPAGVQILIVSRADCFDETLMFSLSAGDTRERAIKLRRKDVESSPKPPARSGAQGASGRAAETR